MVRGFERGQRDTGINDLSQTTQEQEMVVVGLQEMKDSLQKKENELKEYEAIEDKDSRTNKAIKQLKRVIEEFKKYIESNGKTGHDNESVQKIEPKQSPVLEQAKVTDVENVEENILVNRGEAKKPEKTLEDYAEEIADALGSKVDSYEKQEADINRAKTDLERLNVKISAIEREIRSLKGKKNQDKKDGLKTELVEFKLSKRGVLEFLVENTIGADLERFTKALVLTNRELDVLNIPAKPVKKVEAESAKDSKVDVAIEPVTEIEMANDGDIKVINRYIKMFESNSLDKMDELKEKSHLRKIATEKAKKAIESPESYALSEIEVEQLQGFVDYLNAEQIEKERVDQEAMQKESERLAKEKKAKKNTGVESKDKDKKIEPVPEKKPEVVSVVNPDAPPKETPEEKLRKETEEKELENKLNELIEKIDEFLNKENEIKLVFFGDNDPKTKLTLDAWMEAFHRVQKLKNEISQDKAEFLKANNVAGINLTIGNINQDLQILDRLIKKRKELLLNLKSKKEPIAEPKDNKKKTKVAPEAKPVKEPKVPSQEIPKELVRKVDELASKIEEFIAMEKDILSLDESSRKLELLQKIKDLKASKSNFRDRIIERAQVRGINYIIDLINLWDSNIKSARKTIDYENSNIFAERKAFRKKINEALNRGKVEFKDQQDADNFFFNILEPIEGSNDIATPDESDELHRIYNEAFEKLKKEKIKKVGFWGGIATAVLGVGGVSAWLFGSGDNQESKVENPNKGVVPAVASENPAEEKEKEIKGKLFLLSQETKNLKKEWEDNKEKIIETMRNVPSSLSNNIFENNLKDLIQESEENIEVIGSGGNHKDIYRGGKYSKGFRVIDKDVKKHLDGLLERVSKNLKELIAFRENFLDNNPVVSPAVEPVAPVSETPSPVAEVPAPAETLPPVVETLPPPPVMPMENIPDVEGNKDQRANEFESWFDKSTAVHLPDGNLAVDIGKRVRYKIDQKTFEKLREKHRERESQKQELLDKLDGNIFSRSVVRNRREREAIIDEFNKNTELELSRIIVKCDQISKENLSSKILEKEEESAETNHQKILRNLRLKQISGRTLSEVEKKFLEKCEAEELVEKSVVIENQFAKDVLENIERLKELKEQIGSKGNSDSIVTNQDIERWEQEAKTFVDKSSAEYLFATSKVVKQKITSLEYLLEVSK